MNKKKPNFDIKIPDIEYYDYNIGSKYEPIIMLLIVILLNIIIGIIWYTRGV